MKTVHLFASACIILLTSLTLSAQNGRPVRNPDGPFKVTIGECTHGRVEVTPAIPADGIELPKGTVLKIKAYPDPGYAFECGYMAQNGGFAYYDEYYTPEFEVTVNTTCSVGASFVEPERLQGYKCIRDVVYAKPGVKTLKYDAFIPDGAKKLPGVVIIHGGGWRMNCEDVMKGLARELCKDGKYVVFSIDYRWIGNADGDAEPNTMTDIIEDCYGAILHIQEHAKEYGLDPKKLLVGDGGFGKTPGVYQYLPTYMPKGMSAKKARKNLLAIKAVAPNYGIFNLAGVQRYGRDLPLEAQKAWAPIENIPSPKKRKIPQWINRGTADNVVSDEGNQEYYDALKAAGQEAYYVKVPGAAHAYYDWKPDSATKATFVKYGEPYARQMEDFFNTVFYKK